jgi:hypothetical protein
MRSSLSRHNAREHQEMCMRTIHLHRFACYCLALTLCWPGSWTRAAPPQLAPFDAGAITLETPLGWQARQDKKAKSNNWVFTPNAQAYPGAGLHVMLGKYEADIRAPFEALLASLLKGAPGNPRIVDQSSGGDGQSATAVVEYGDGQVRQVLHARTSREHDFSVIVVFNGRSADADALEAQHLVQAVAANARRSAGRNDSSGQARAHEQTKAIVSGSDSAVLIEKVRPKDQNQNIARGAPVADASALFGKWIVGEAHSTMDIREASFDAITGSSSYEFAANGSYVYVYQKTLVNPPFSSGMQMRESGHYRLADSMLRLEPDRAEGWVYNLNSKKQPISEKSPPQRSYEVRAFTNGILLTGGCSKYQMDFDAYCKSGKALDFPMRPAQ